MKNEERFERVHIQGNGFTGPSIEVFVDRETGVQYLFASHGYSGGLCPLLDVDGKPLLYQSEEEE